MAKVYLDGQLIAKSASERAIIEQHLPTHIALSRAEPGCLKFEVSQDPEAPHCFHVSEIFDSESSFDSHQARTRASDWGRATEGVLRRFDKRVE